MFLVTETLLNREEIKSIISDALKYVGIETNDIYVAARDYKAFVLVKHANFDSEETIKAFINKVHKISDDIMQIVYADFDTYKTVSTFHNRYGYFEYMLCDDNNKPTETFRVSQLS